MSADATTVATCRYEHHAAFGKPIACERCGAPLACGPFGHACRACEPFEFEPCACGVLRIYCSC